MARVTLEGIREAFPWTKALPEQDQRLLLHDMECWKATADAHAEGRTDELRETVEPIDPPGDGR